MNIKRIGSLFIGILVIIFLLITFVFDNTSLRIHSLTVDENIPYPEPQQTDERVWENIIVQEFRTIEQFGNDAITMVTQIEISDDGILYVLDFPQKIIARISSKGEFLRTIGKGEGDGPGEFRQPIDFAVTGHGYLYVADASQKSVTTFNPAGEVVDFIRLDEIPHRIAVKDNVYMIMRAGIGEFFYFYNDNWDIINRGGMFLKEQKELPIPLDILIQQHDESFFVLFNNAGYLVCYDTSGALRYYRKTIDDVPFPDLQIRTIGESRRISLAPEAPMVHTDMNISSDNIYIVSAYASQRMEGNYVIDVYNQNNGDYLYSFTFPEYDDTYGIVAAKVWNSLLATAEIREDGSSIIRLYRITRR